MTESAPTRPASPTCEHHASYGNDDGTRTCLLRGCGMTFTPPYESSDNRRVVLDLCPHCGRSDEADGDHTCLCPYNDIECASRLGGGAPCWCPRYTHHHRWVKECGWNNTGRPAGSRTACFHTGTIHHRTATCPRFVEASS